MAVLAIDFETANESRSSACAVGLAWIERDEIVRQAYSLIKPAPFRMRIFEQRVHGLQLKDLADQPTLPEVLDQIAPDLAGSLVVAHNASFDIEVLCAGYTAYGLPPPEVSFLCSQQIARRIWPDRRSYSLDAIANLLGFTFKHHHAREDARVCASVMIEAARIEGVSDVAGLSRSMSCSPGCVDTHGIRGVAWGPPQVGNYLKMHEELRLAKVKNDYLTFTVRGSTGSHYIVTASGIDADIKIKCECVGWRSHKRCKHIFALLHGVIDDLLSGNASDLTLLQRQLAAFGGLLPEYKGWTPSGWKGF